MADVAIPEPAAEDERPESWWNPRLTIKGVFTFWLLAALVNLWGDYKWYVGVAVAAVVLLLVRMGKSLRYWHQHRSDEAVPPLTA